MTRAEARVLGDAAGLHAVQAHALEAKADDSPRRLWHEALSPVLAGEDVAQLGARVLGRVAHVHAAGADERAVVFEDYPPAAEVPLS
jgi:broad specificity phosphatase PhoE